MDLTPQHLRRVEFREKWRGYDPDEVDDYLERVAAVFELLQDRLRQATERAHEAEARLVESRESDEQLRRTLLVAQRTADATTEEAREEAARVVGEAERRAAEVEREADERARRRVAEAEGELRGRIAALETARDRLQDDADALERYLAEAKGAVERALRQELTRLRELGVGGPARPPVHAVQVPPAVEGDDAADGDGPADVAEPQEAGAEAEPEAAPLPWAERIRAVSDQAADDDDGGGEATAQWSAEEALRDDPAPAPVFPGGPMAAVRDGEVDYFPDLREAMAEEAPLGPREHDPDAEGDDDVMAQELPEGGRFRSILRRRHD